MKHSFIYPASLSLFLVASPSYGNQWERHLDAEAMGQSVSVTAGTPRYDWPEVQAKRREQLERDLYEDAVFDIENLPPTAAGPQGNRGMSRKWAEVEANRRRQLERSMF